ncbi:MAG: FtsH protease activity modulator HflK [Steroidobacteraceae bacterium]
MAWNQPGGGKNPWGRRPGQGGTDLEEKVKSWQRKLESVLRAASPGSPGSRPVVLAVVLIAVALWLGSGFFQVGAAQRGVIERFGKLVEVRGQGWGWRWPWPIETVTRVNVMSVASQDSTPTVLTADLSLVDLRLDVQYRLADPLKVLFGVRNPVETLRQVSLTVIRELVGERSLQSVLTGAARPQITGRAQTLIQQLLDRYGTGIEVTSVNLTGVDVPDPVVQAQQDANKAIADEQQTVDAAQAYASGVVPAAKGEAAKIMQEAQAYQDRVVALAQGKAALFTQLDAAYKRAPAVTRERLYLETMEDILGRANKVVIASKPGGAGGNVLYLPLDKLIDRGASDVGNEEPPEGGGAASSTPSDADTVTVEGRSRGRR